MSSCKEKEPENPQKGILKLGEVAFVDYGKSVAFLAEEKDTITISFSRVLFDSRCPLPSCYLTYGTRADIEISMLYQKNNYTLPYTLWGGMTQDNTESYQDTLGYRIHVFRLDPYPEEEPIDSTDYKIKLKIMKL
jgi:hypothetical protein